jgi:hypothetical protein
MAGRGEVVAQRASDGSLRFDPVALDARLGVRSWQVSLDAPFW